MQKKPYIITGIVITLIIVAGAVISMILGKVDEPSIAIIGGADGPTSYYFSFGNIFLPLVLIGITVIIICIVYFIKRK